MGVLLRSSMIAADELRREFGFRKSVEIMLEIGRRDVMGRPFRGLPPAVDPKEAATRAELAPAVNLYHVLLEQRPAPDAFAVARRIILNSSLVHLRSIYPSFQGRDFLALADGDPRKAGERLGAEFAFADTTVIEMTRERASFDVVRCRIPGVLAQVDASALAPIFCEVDSIYFPIYEPNVDLRRTGTIIRGGTVCDFRLTWHQDV
jgi:hypothetical protein